MPSKVSSASSCRTSAAISSWTNRDREGSCKGPRCDGGTSISAAALTVPSGSPTRSRSSDPYRASASLAGPTTTVSSRSVLRWLWGSNALMVSISSPKKSSRTGASRFAGQMSRMLPRWAKVPAPSTMLTFV